MLNIDWYGLCHELVWDIDRNILSYDDLYCLLFVYAAVSLHYQNEYILKLENRNSKDQIRLF